MPVAHYNVFLAKPLVRLADSVQALDTSASVSAQVGGTGTWSAAAIPIATLVDPVKDVPTIVGAGGNQNYTEKRRSQSCWGSGVSLADVDETHRSIRAVISVSGGFVPGEPPQYSPINWELAGSYKLREPGS